MQSPTHRLSSRLVPRLALSAALCSFALAAHAGQSPGWNEAVNGDFSNNGLTPDFVLLSQGVTTIRGTTGRAVAGGLVDLDYFTITVPDGYTLDSMEILPGTLSVGAGSFLGLMAGPQFTVGPETPSAAGLMGWTLFDDGNIGSDALLFMAAPSFGSTGYSTPLPAGQYSFWVQETGVGVATYGFALTVTAVPEPATALMLLAGLGLLGAALKRRWQGMKAAGPQR